MVSIGCANIPSNCRKLFPFKKEEVVEVEAVNFCLIVSAVSQSGNGKSFAKVKSTIKNLSSNSQKIPLNKSNILNSTINTIKTKKFQSQIQNTLLTIKFFWRMFRLLFVTNWMTAHKANPSDSMDWCCWPTLAPNAKFSPTPGGRHEQMIQIEKDGPGDLSANFSLFTGWQTGKF